MKENQKGYFERFCEFRQEVIAKIVETLGEKEVNLEEEEFIAYLEQYYPKCAKVYKEDKNGFTTAEIVNSLGLSAE